MIDFINKKVIDELILNLQTIPEKNAKDFVLTYLKEKTIPVSLDVDSARLTYCEWCGWLGEFQEDFNCPICNKNTYCNSIDYIADTTSPNGVNCFNVFKDVFINSGYDTDHMNNCTCSDCEEEEITNE